MKTFHKQSASFFCRRLGVIGRLPSVLGCVTLFVSPVWLGCSQPSAAPPPAASSPSVEASSVDEKPILSKSSSETEASDTATKPVVPLGKMSDDGFRFAAYEGQLEAVQKAIAAGNNVNAADPQQSLTALHMAAYNGHHKIVQLLLEHGATVDSLDGEGKTPLIHACTGPFPDTVKALLKAGADINVREGTEAFTPLMMAAGLGQLEVVNILLQHGADKSLLDNDGDSALQHAQNSGHNEIAVLLSSS